MGILPPLRGSRWRLTGAGQLFHHAFAPPEGGLAPRARHGAGFRGPALLAVKRCWKRGDNLKVSDRVERLA
jgi:hypothetical protein